MRAALVGYTGFVGGNIAASCEFDGLYNSKNISNSFGEKYDLLVYAGVRAEKFLANRNPQGDRAMIMQAFENIKRIDPKKVVLISTIDVYRDTSDKDETSRMLIDNLQPYGKNRLELESLVQEHFDSLVVRLPALFGKGIKKNFIFDALTVIPSMLNEEKYKALSDKSELVKESYRKSVNGFYTLDNLKTDKKNDLREFFENNDWNALYFTDSRNRYQFYDLGNLWRDIKIALDNSLTLLNLTSEPISASEISEKCFGREFKNIMGNDPVEYDLRSIHAELFGGENGYCYSKDKVMNALKKFIMEYQR
ncbi:MAG: NAD(P)-dependent oxidoreductase [Oscillospiraceae bacterium]|nr:NAD(P)-dependent oxidoreductase [Oscillospiraceae bacterium]